MVAEQFVLSSLQYSFILETFFAYFIFCKY